MTDITTITYVEETLTQYEDTTLVLGDGTSSVIIATDTAGPQGPAGPSGIFIGPTPPSNTLILWVDTS